MNVNPIVARLQEEMSSNDLGFVGTADTIEDASKQLKNNKVCAFVMFTGEGGGEAQGGSGAVTQRITYRFMVLIGVAGAGFKNMAKGVTVEDMRDRIKDVLMGWTPPGAASPIVLVSSRLMLKDEEQALLFINSEFQTSYFIRKATA